MSTQDIVEVNKRETTLQSMDSAQSSEVLPRIIKLHSIGGRLSNLTIGGAALSERVTRAHSSCEMSDIFSHFKQEEQTPFLKHSISGKSSLSSGSQSHPLSPKKGKDIRGKQSTAKIEEQPKRSKRAYREAQRLEEEGMKGDAPRAHPYNNVVSFFFGRKGFINFLNIIRRALRQKNYNSLSFKELLLSDL